MKKQKLKAYTLIDGKAQMYILDASISNIAHFIMSQPILSKTIVITDMEDNLVCSTIEKFLDCVPAQRLVPFFHQHIIPLQTGEKEPHIALPEPKQVSMSDFESFQMLDCPGAEQLSNYLFYQETAITFQSPHGYSAQVHLYVGAYQDNNSLYVGLFDVEEDEEWGDITVNVTESEGLDPYCAAVKNYTENEGMEQFIEKYELGRPTGQVLQSGYVSLPVYQFDKDKLAILSLDGVEGYEKALKTSSTSRLPIQVQQGGTSV